MSSRMVRLTETLRSLRGERGSAMLITGVAMVVLIGFTAMAVDGGYLYYRHTQMQDIADAAALAAAHQAIKTSGTVEDKQQAAFNVVLKCAQKNGLQTSNVSGFACDVALGDEMGRLTVSFAVGPEEFQVEITLNTSLFFARVLSIDTAALGAQATAEVIHVDGAGQQSLLPLAFFGGTYVPNVRTQLTFTPGDGVAGNYGYLDYKPSNLFDDYLAHGFSNTVTMGNVLETYPGQKTGQVRPAIASRIAGCTHGCSVVDQDGDNDGDNLLVNVTEPCPRVIVIPAVAGFFDSNGRSYVTVTGFVKFFIEGYDDQTKVLTGWPLGQVAASNYQSTEGLAMRSVRLKR